MVSLDYLAPWFSPLSYQKKKNEYIYHEKEMEN